jgi:hypothetical protein
VETAPDIRFKGSAHILADQIQVEPLRVEMPAAPSPGFRMLRVPVVGHDLEKGLVPRRSADILGRAGPGAVEAGGLERGRIKNQRLFQFNGMAPAIAEIVEIKKTPARPVVEIPQPDFRFVEEPAVVVGLRLADLLVSPVGQAADPEFMQMGPVTT